MAGGETPPSSPLPIIVGNAKIHENHPYRQFDDTCWIIDTGATHHVTGNKSWLFDTRYIECPVGLPNGESVFATLEGSVKLSDQITISGVLFVPHINCNLIYVTQLSHQLNVVVQFNSYMLYRTD